MCVIIQEIQEPTDDENIIGKIYLLIKGADNVIISMLSPDYLEDKI